MTLVVLLLTFFVLFIGVSDATPYPYYKDGIGYGELCVKGGCPPELFCGMDNECHPRTCEDFYMYAPVEWTGREEDEEASDALTCEMDDRWFPTEIQVSCLKWGDQ